MAVRNFTLYDLLADIVPGALTIVFGFVLYNFQGLDKASDSALVAGGAFFVLAYFIGRIFHTIGSILDPCFKSIYKSILGNKKYNSFNDCDDIEQDNSFSVYKKKYEINELLKISNTINLIDKKELPLGLSSKILEGINEEIRNELGIGYSGKQAKRYGEALVYKETTLYSKYNSIVTFFRSSLLISTAFLLHILALQIIICLGADYHQVNIASDSVIVAISLLIATLPLSLYAGSKFWKVRNIAFLNDLHTILSQDSNK